MTTVQELQSVYSQRGDFLTGAEEALADREIVLCIGDDTIPDRFDLPRSLRHANTKVIEIFNSVWSDPDVLANTVLPYLGEMCEFWENVTHAHEAALRVFADAEKSGNGYCLYLRSFSKVATPLVETQEGDAVAYFNDERLDRNFARALAEHAATLNPVVCLHTDDMAFLEGKWRVPAFRVHTNNWRRVLRDAIASAKLIVFYLADASGGVDFELDEIERLGLAARTVLVHDRDDFALPTRRRGFAAVIPLSQFLTPGVDEAVRMTKPALQRLTALACDAYRPPIPAPSLARLPFSLVDPGGPEELPDGLDPERSLVITEENATAFAWYVSAFPAAIETWNHIARGLYREKRAPTRDVLDSLQRHLIQASLGASALGFTASLSALIGFRTIFANLVQIPDVEVRAQRKANLLKLLELADRFDDLTQRKIWRAQNDKWRETILEDAFS